MSELTPCDWKARSRIVVSNVRDGPTEYVRADIADQMLAALKDAHDALGAADPDCIHDETLAEIEQDIAASEPTTEGF